MSIEFFGDGDPAVTVAKLRALADDIERMTVFAPGDALRDAPSLDGWRLCLRPRPALAGHATDHPLLGSRRVVTSEIFAIDRRAGWVRTASRFYTIGRPAGRQEFKQQ
jgi:hypothetical protein